MEDEVYIEHKDFCIIQLDDCITLSDIQVSDLDNMKRSIQKFGVITPILVEQSKVGYIVLQGHRRVAACVELGITKVPAVILHSNVERDLLWLESKMSQESFATMSLSEKALMVFTYYSRIKVQGRRSDLSETKEKHSSASSSKLRFNTSERTISRYLRLHLLCEGLKQFVDKGIIPFRAGVELSYLRECEQWEVFDLLCSGSYGILGEDKAKAIRRLSITGQFNIAHVAYILQNLHKDGVLLVYKRIYKKFELNKFSSEELENVLDLALSAYFRESDNNR